tara:strand:+ start:3959 stop:4762 length:804 start_codon:yes stop_codon:yes gene_type:complete
MTPIRTTLALLALISSIGSSLAQEPPLPARENFHLFLLVGQSNMAGRGQIAEVDLKPHPRVLMLTKELEWTPAVDPMHFDKPPIVGVGLGKSFGIEIAKSNPEITIGLIPCAVGGSPIDTWLPGGFHPSTNTHPWDDMLPRAKAALKVGTLKAILWHQGESDSNFKNAPLYQDRLHWIVRNFRQELGYPDVPFIAGQMGRFENKAWDDWRIMVDQAHQNLPKSIANTAFVRSDGLTHKGDFVHFSALGYRKLGQRYASAYRALIATQ